MGIFDRLLGGKNWDEKSGIEPEIRGEAPKSSKKTIARKVNRIEICFNSTSPPYSEPEVIKDLIRYFGLADSLTTDVYITTSYGHISGVAEYLSSREMPDELQAFVMARAMIIGMVHDPKEMNKIRVTPFHVSNTLGILIIKEV
jgi:hypothetical protein